MSGLWQDLRYALRGLARNRMTSCTATLVLSLAIGATTAVFSVVDKVLLKPLPIADDERVVVIWPRERANPTTIGEISHWTFRHWQQHADSFESLAAVGSVNWSLLLREGGELTRLPVAAVSASFFPLVRTPAMLGRTLLAGDDRRGAVDVVVLSYASWVRRFGCDPEILGRRLILGGKPYTVVGVMPDGFDYPRGAELWVPVVPQLVSASLKWGLDALESPWFGVLWVVGRLKQDVTPQNASSEVSALIERNAGEAFPPGLESTVTPIREHIFGKTRPALIALAATVGLVLLIACVNVATLLLIRATARKNETAIRLAVGASRWRLLRQSLMDAVVLSTLAGLGGIVIAQWISAGLVMLAPDDVPRLDTVQFDGRTVMFAWLACLLVAAVAGIVPGLHASHWNLSDVLKATGGSRLTGSRKLRQGFVVAQIAIAMALLVAAGLVGRSFLNLTRLDFGFDPSEVLTLDITVPEAPPERRDAFYTALLERVRALPGVEAAGAIFLRPLEHTGIGTDARFLLEGQQVEDLDNNPKANYEAITPGYFDAMRMRVLRGRAFTDADDPRRPQVVIVSDGLARRLWPGEAALGKRLLRPGAPRDQNGKPLYSTIVGVVENARYRGITDVRFDLYVPYLQNPNDPVKHLMVRTSGEPLAFAPVIRAEALQLEPAALVEGVTTMADIVGGAMAPWRFSASTMVFLSLLALLIAVLGIYGIARQAALERTREIALRVALGASRGAISGLMIHEGLPVVMMGVGIGVLMAAATSRILAGLLFGVEPIDPLTFIAIAALVTIVATMAMLFPARRAARVDPLMALRYE